MNRIIRAAMHFPVGMIAGVLCGLVPWAGFVFSLGFFLYETNEDRHINDQAWIDITGWLIGLPFGAAAYYLVGWH